MKKTLGKPENWQDFESLCKKLWGEVWCIPNKIKKNGRLGQDQSGIDVYGKPKGENEYWGIQCKGKDDYSNAKLTKKEILKEIEKAKDFNPKLAVFIIATSANKDAKIEEIVRELDVESRKNEGFEILLYCWEDIVDLIEDYDDTHQWYLRGIGHKGRFDFRVVFNKFEEKIVLQPIFEKEITHFQLLELNDFESPFQSILTSSLHLSSIHNLNNILYSNTNKINKSWCKFELVMENIGSAVIEDWSFRIKFISGVKQLHKESVMFMPMPSLTTYINLENKSINYNPLKNHALIQKDNRFFEIQLLPELETEKIVAEWEILARDFNLKGNFDIIVKPEYVINRIDCP